MAEQTTTLARTTDRHLRRWDPFETLSEEMARLSEEMARFWQQSWPFGPWPFTRRLGEPITVRAAWTPRMDVFEKNSDLIVKVELPGVKKDDIDVEVQEGDLVIKGERRAESEVKEENYYRMERSYGSFMRRLTLPESAQTDKIQATYTDGVLEIKIPKAVEAKAQPRKIKIS